MSGCEYRFDGLDEMERKLSQMIEKQYPDEFKQMVLQVAYELQGEVKSNTPVDKGFLIEGWKVGKVIKRGKDYYIEVYNNMEYCEPVEYGHRLPKGGGFVPGASMMGISLELINKRLPQYLQQWIANFIATHEL